MAQAEFNWSPLQMNESILPRCEERCYPLVKEWGFTWNTGKTRVREANNNGTYLVLPRGANPWKAFQGHIYIPEYLISTNTNHSVDLFRTQRWARRTKLLDVCKYLLPISSHSHNCSGSAGLTLEIVDLKYPSTIIKTLQYWHRNRQADQQNRTDSPRMHKNLIYDKKGILDQWGMKELFNR